MRYTKIVLQNVLSIVAIIAALIAAVASIGGGIMNTFLAANCMPAQFLCPTKMYILFILAVVGGCLIVTFAIPITADLMIALCKWIKEIVQNYINRPFNVFCKIYRKGNEVFLEIKNREWFIDAFPIYIKCSFLYNGELIQIPLKWRGVSDTSEALIHRRKSRTSHFATINNSTKEYNLHLSNGRDLTFPFRDERYLEFQITGYTSASPTKLSKYIINYRLVILEFVKQEKIDFKIGVQG